MDSMTEGTDEESDGLDDSEFLAQLAMYVDNCESRTLDLLKAEQDRQAVSDLILRYANIVRRFEMLSTMWLFVVSKDE